MKLDMLHHCYILWRVECGEMFFKGALQLTMSITQKLFQREKKNIYGSLASRTSITPAHLWSSATY